MPVSTGIPTSWQIPLFWAVVDGSKAGNLTEPQRALLVGQMITTGTLKGVAALDVPIPIGSIALAAQQFGPGSMLTRMVTAFFNSNTTQQLWCVPVAEPGAGVAAVGSISFLTPATASGTYTVYIAGQKVQISVATTDTITAIAANLVLAINAITSMPVLATSAVGVVTLTCNWKGLTGNDIRLVENYLGVFGGEIMPTGITTTVVQVGTGTAGTAAPTFTNTISAIQSLEYDYVAIPYNDTASMTTWNTEMGFNSGGRWNFTRQQYGLIVNCNRDTFANLITWGTAGGAGATQNSPVMSTMAVEVDSPTPIWEWAAAYCALAALGFSADPARPLQTLEFLGVLPARLQNRFTSSQINSLSNSGLAIQAVAPDGNPMIMREQTQYQLNSFGQGDTAFGLLTIIATLQEILRRMKSAITSKYPRVKLIPDGTKIGPGQAAVTPTDVKAELIAEYAAAEFDGLVSDMKDFKANLIVEIDSVDPNQLNVLWPPQLAGQLRQFQALAQFRLLYPPQVLT